MNIKDLPFKSLENLSLAHVIKIRQQRLEKKSRRKKPQAKKKNQAIKKLTNAEILELLEELKEEG